MTYRALLNLSLAGPIYRIKVWLLNRKLIALYQLRDYFVWQTQNGNAGLQDTDKRICVLESDIRNLR